MEPIAFARYLSLALLLTAWCVLHSFLVSIPVKDYLDRRLGRGFRFYRLFFNLISLLSLIPVFMFSHSLRSQAIFTWDGYLRPVQFSLLAIALLLFFLGGRGYDFREFLGIKQIREDSTRKEGDVSRELKISGVLAFTRHPWYLASILLIWARTLDLSVIAENAVLTSYLVIGTVLEERKLIREFGKEYSEYQRRVSMLLPMKWLSQRIGESHRETPGV